MRIFYRRPLAAASVLFAITAVLAWRLPTVPKIVLLVLFGVAFSAFLFVRLIIKRRSRCIFLSILFLFFILLSLLSSFFFFNVRYARFQQMSGNNCQVYGYVLERMDSGSFYSYFRVRLDSIDSERERVDAILEFDYPSALQVGDRFYLQGTVRGYLEDAFFDEETYRLSDGCLMIVSCTDESACQILQERKNDLLIFSKRLNTKLSFELQSAVGGKSGGVAAALLLGNRTWLSDSTILDFRRAGISHLLALSGLHVSILIGFLELLLRRVRTPFYVRAILIPLAALFYLLLTGMAVSTSRAVLMICVLYLSKMLKSGYDSFTALCAALFVILLFSPYAVLDLSLWMSFLAAGSIVIFSPGFTKTWDDWQGKSCLPSVLLKPLRVIAIALFVGIVANMALMLLSALVFGEICLTSIPATLCESIPVTLLLIVSAIGMCFPFLGVLSFLCAPLGDLILTVATFFSNMENVLLAVRDPLCIILLSILSVVLILAAVLKLAPKRLALILAVLFLAVAPCSALVTQISYGNRIYATKLSAGVGEVRLYSKAGHGVLIHDTRGNASEAFSIKRAALDTRCTELDSVVFSRYYNQATYFIAELAGTIRVYCIHLPIPQNDAESAIAARLEQEAALYGIEVRYDAASYLEREALFAPTQ